MRLVFITSRGDIVKIVRIEGKFGYRRKVVERLLVFEY